MCYQGTHWDLKKMLYVNMSKMTTEETILISPCKREGGQERRKVGEKRKKLKKDNNNFLSKYQ